MRHRKIAAYPLNGLPKGISLTVVSDMINVFYEWFAATNGAGSVIVPTVCHAVWNGIDYPLYGFGEKIGALGIEQTHIYGPEVGVLGLGLNLIFAAALWFWVTNRRVNT